MKKTVLVALMGVGALAMSLGVGAAPTAQAGSGQCGGDLISRKVARLADGTAIGELMVYFNSSNGYNCARFNHLGPSVGVARSTTAYIEKCASNDRTHECNPAEAIQWDYDEGLYAYYAGPVRVHAPHVCVRASGSIQWNGTRRWAEVLTGC